jgi:hypothetical protein
MLHTYHLDTTNHSDFLKQKRVDPITGEKIEEGHTIVICAACKSAFFIESWEYLGNTHCSQEQTLAQIPVTKTLQLALKPLEYLPFLFRKGSYYPWDKKEADTEFYKLILLAIGGSVLGLFMVAWSLFWLQNGFLFFIELIILSIIVWIISLIFKTKQKKRAFRRKQNVSKSIYLAIDLKNQSINYKKGNKISKIDFDQLSELKYKLKYMPFKECAKHNQFILSLEFLTQENKKIRYYTVFHEKEIPNWSKFLEELPYTIPVLNQK